MVIPIQSSILLSSPRTSEWKSIIRKLKLNSTAHCQYVMDTITPSSLLKSSFNCCTVFENYPKCLIWNLKFWHFPPIYTLLKVTCLVTLFDRKLQIFKNSPKWTIFGIFKMLNETFSVIFKHRDVGLDLEISDLQTFVWLWEIPEKSFDSQIELKSS